MRKIFSIIILSLFFSTYSFSQILNLKCTFNSGWSLPEQIDLSSKKGEVQFYEIDLKNKKILDSPGGPLKNNKTNYKYEYVRINTDEIAFGYRMTDGTRLKTTEINRQTGELEETWVFNMENIKQHTQYTFLCVKTDSKNKF